MSTKPLPVDEMLAKAKAEMGNANRRFPQSPAPVTQKVTPGKPVPQPPPSDDGVGEGLKWRAEQGKVAAKPLGQFKEGGMVPKTGNYKLHKGETILTADEGKNMAKKKDSESSLGMSAMAGLGGHGKKSKKKIHMHVEPTDNDGYITKQHSEGGEKMSEPDHTVHAHSNLDALMKHVKSTYGAANTSDENKQADESTPESPAPSSMAPSGPGGSGGPGGVSA